MDIKELHRQGVSARKIAVLTGHSRNTVAKVLDQATPQPAKTVRRRSSLDQFKPYVKHRYELYGLSARRLHEEICAQGFTGSADVVERYLKTLKDQATANSRATVRFETAPGEQAQADWAEVGIVAGEKIYVFVIVLGFSRMTFIAFTRSMVLPELIRCQQEAFRYFGGVPASVLYDNMAQVRLPYNKELNPLMADFAAHYGFAIKTHRPYRPRTKGKVERTVQFVEDNFLKGRAFSDFEDLCAQGDNWLRVANERVHATTGERPIDTLKREKLTSIDSFVPYVVALTHERRVDTEGFVAINRARYSVPPDWVRKRVTISVGEQRVTIRYGDTIVAEHRPVRAGESSVQSEHLAAFWKLATDPAVPRPALSDGASPVPLFENAPHLPSVEVRSLSVYEDFCPKRSEELT